MAYIERMAWDLVVVKHQALTVHGLVVAVVAGAHLDLEEVGIEDLVLLQWSQPAAIVGPVLVLIWRPQLGLGRSSLIPTQVALEVGFDLLVDLGLLWVGHTHFVAEAVVFVRASVVQLLLEPSLSLSSQIHHHHQATWKAQAIAVDSLG